MSREDGAHGSTGYRDSDFAAFGTEQTSLDALRRTSDSELSFDNDLNGILREYLILELGKSNKKIIHKHIHLSQSMKISNIKKTSTLLNTVLKHKVINTQFEVDFKLACIDASHLCNYLTQIEDKEEEPNDSLTLQSSHLEDSNFKNQFFVTRCSFQLICAHLMQEYANMAYKRTELDVEKQLMVTLTYLGTVQSYKEIGSKFNIAISTAHKCVNDVINTLFNRMGELIFWPVDEQANTEVQAFNAMPSNRFPGIIGVIGTVDLKKSCTANPSKHTKDGSSIGIQCVCNNRYQFYNVFTSYLLKSSVTTSTFLESPLAEMILNNPDTLFPNINTHIVGQCCYPLLPNLMTPFSEYTLDTESHKNYNDAIKIPLNIINLAFGKLLGRFKRLLCLDLWGQDKFALLIFAACCLHNLCLGNEDDIDCKPYECCTFQNDYYDELGVQKREELCDNILIINKKLKN